LSDSEKQFDGKWMRRALRLAQISTGVASPNPQVGCVLVRVSDGTIIGQGAHVYDLYDHAEIVALKDAAKRGANVQGATAYVTLEPCSHHGRTGPCADALIAAGVGRVVVATIDPNPQVSGRGLGKLRAAGVEVTVGVCEREARELNDGFARFIETRRPLVTLKAAVSVDGMLAPPPASRVGTEPYWLSGAPARAEVQNLRHASDAVLTGIGTVLADDPALTDRSGLRRRRSLLRVVLDSQLHMPLESKLVQSAAWDVLVVCGKSAEAGRRAALEAAGITVETVEESDGRLALPEVLDALGRRKILSVLLECGSTLNGAFLKAGLVDKVVLFYAEQELGTNAVPFAEGIGPPNLVEQSLRSATRTYIGRDVRVTGYLRDPWLIAEADALG
jgi:diaminohydroxyphosphoribosylaminopyrimidine deaminase/5-amino-6-(5-phosphoribosylamino)uracil reductase